MFCYSTRKIYKEIKYIINMPKLIPFEKISDTKFEFDGEMKVTGYDARIQTPYRLGKQIAHKKIKVTIEVLE